MEQQSSSQTPAGAPVAGMLFFLVVAVLVGSYFFPQYVSWGSLTLAPSRVITVTGSATERQQNQVAQFTAGVSSVNDNRDRALEEVNNAMNTLVEQIKNFGIKSEDIKTENVSVYQGEETFYENGQAKQRPGQWRVSNSVTVTLRDIDRASSLTQLLTTSGATNVYGPNFMLDNDDRPEDALLSDAIANAKEKAEVMAQASGGKVGKVVSVSEGVSTSGVYPVYARLEGGGGGGGPVEPGTSSVTKQVTVTFELTK